ncbi:MAG: nickel-dependent hydrogenase large subunit [Patescibacteria group bacterium]|nr:nickel-dependent hydrogenase large subunit [Patescibacteria group bacterium]
MPTNKKITISINAINKIEGHAGFVGKLENGLIHEARLEVKEGARLIEGILIGRKYTEAPWITARICGICPTVHNLTAIKAIENALRVKASPQTTTLRKLMLFGQFIQSHMTHIYFLALSDFFNLKNDLALVKINPKTAKEAIQIRDFGNLILNAIGGRNIHPTTTAIGGFRKLPSGKMLNKILNAAKKNLETANDLFDFLNNLTFPEFQRLTVFAALSNKQEYALYNGQIKLPKNKTYSPRIFLRKANEKQEMAEDLIKKVKIVGESYLVGALSRVNLNYKKLNPFAHKALARTEFSLPCYNIFYNLLAQMIEVIHATEETIKIISKLKIKTEKIQKYKTKAGRGLGVTEAPRGLLFHYYETDARGFIKNCNIITPTAQFLANLENDLEKFLENNKKEDDIKMLIRAYDPCITCAVH